MHHNRLGRSGFRVPALSFGTATFGGKGDFFKEWGTTDAKAATRLVDTCLDAGITMFDSADVYSDGEAETVLGAAIKGRANKLLISTKASFRSGDGPNDVGASRAHLISSVNASLRRLGVDHIDLFQLHAFDALTPVKETLSTLDALVTAGKLRYLGVSNFSGWHLMRSLAAADRLGLTRYVAHQAYYSLIGREYEWELMPLGLAEGVGAIVWSPLAGGQLSGKFRRGAPLPKVSRLHKTSERNPQVERDYLYKVVDALDAAAKETGKSVAQVALNWVAHRPTVASVIVGARDERQLKDNVGAVGWRLTPEQVKRLDEASAVLPVYPYWHQRQSFAERNPPPV